MTAAKNLIDEMTVGTGLPEEPLAREMKRLLERSSLSKETCGLDQLREVLAEYAQEILLEAKNNYGK